MSAGLPPDPKPLENVFLWLGPAAAALVLWLGIDAWGLSGPAAATAAITAWCAVWWLTEPVPIPVTSLLPRALPPLARPLRPAGASSAMARTEVSGIGTGSVSHSTS